MKADCTLRLLVSIHTRSDSKEAGRTLRDLCVSGMAASDLCTCLGKPRSRRGVYCLFNTISITVQSVADNAQTALMPEPPATRPGFAAFSVVKNELMRSNYARPCSRMPSTARVVMSPRLCDSKSSPRSS